MYRAPRWVSPCRLLSIVLDAPYLPISFYFPTPKATRVLRARASEIRYVYCAISSTLKYRKHCNYSNVVSWRTHFGISNCVCERDRLRREAERGGEPFREGEIKISRSGTGIVFANDFAAIRYFQMRPDTGRANVRKYRTCMTNVKIVRRAKQFLDR